MVTFRKGRLVDYAWVHCKKPTSFSLDASATLYALEKNIGILISIPSTRSYRTTHYLHLLSCAKLKL